MSLQLSGTIRHIGDLQTGEGKNKPWQKREFVLDYKDGNYDKIAPFTIMGDKVSLLDSKRVGDTVTVSFNVDGREHQGRWYTNLVCWKIE